MANLEHLDIVLQGVEVWNQWRSKNRSVSPDLIRADLRGADLRGANFYRASLYGATLCDANLYKADLSVGDLRMVNLRGANLHGANLKSANFGGSYLGKANLSRVKLLETIFVDTNLEDAQGLHDCEHFGPSSLDHRTLAKSGRLNLGFLRGCGLPDALIEYLPSLLQQAIQFYSCFISYSTKDQEFADRLHADLQNKGVRCWFAPHKIQGGKKIHEQIDEAIRLHDRLLLILSEASMNSEWVKTEIAHARQKEVKQRRKVLFPIGLAPFSTIRDWKCFDADIGRDSACEIREYYVPDFSNWKQHDAYQKEFGRLVRDLQAEEAGEIRDLQAQETEEAEEAEEAEEIWDFAEEIRELLQAEQNRRTTQK